MTFTSQAWIHSGQVVPLLLDSFTDPNGTAITSHTPDINKAGGNWGEQISYGDGATIEGNRLQVAAGEEIQVYKNVGASRVLLEADITVPNDIEASNMYIEVQIATPTAPWIESGYRLNLQWAGPGATCDMRIFKEQEGAYDTTTRPWGNGETKNIKLSFNGTTIRFLLDDLELLSGTEVGIPLTDTWIAIYMNAYDCGSQYVDNLRVRRRN